MTECVRTGSPKKGKQPPLHLRSLPSHDEFDECVYGELRLFIKLDDILSLLAGCVSDPTRHGEEPPHTTKDIVR